MSSTENPTPLFIFSLPRSGSTLAQRILAVHPDISTVPEPWLLLPHFYALRYRGTYAEYNHVSATSAIEEFCTKLPGGREDYTEELREFALRLYRKASPEDTRYFLDKTPRYHLIVDEIIAAFPDAKFIFLWRHPLAVAASIIETWGGGKWNLFRHKIDLFDGLENLVRACEKNGDKIHTVRYEYLVTDPDPAWSEIFRYLDLEYDGAALERFTDVRLGGRMGDPTGTRRYDKVSRESLERWRDTMNNPFRRSWSRRYLRWLGRKRAATMGYDLDELLKDLDSTRSSNERLAEDFGRASYGLLYDFAEPRILRQKLEMIPSWNRIHVHK